MASVQQTYAFNAFENQLKTLCLSEFPCGLGRWRDVTSGTQKKKGVGNQKDLPDHRFFITHKDYGAQNEKTETLEELVTVKRSPWNLDYSWSNEAKELREIAVRSPWLIDNNFVLSHFQTLRIVDKGVTEIDEHLLYFTNLRELSLSVNKLTCVNSRHLPKSLEVLELCANQIWSLSELCMQPPPLQHLGLGYNKISMVDDYITGLYWPCLLSLDLSHNNLCDLIDIVRKLNTLPKLRNLILQGNPLALVPAYRGYTVDSLRLLDILDDLPISADERHHFKGLAKRREYILDEAKLIFKVDFLKGVPMPDEMKNPEEHPEYPIISRKYFAQFMFLEDKSSTAELFHLLHDDDLSTITGASRTGHSNMGASDRGSALPILDETKETDTHIDCNSAIATEKNVNFASTLEALPNAQLIGEGSIAQQSDGHQDYADDDVSVIEAAEMRLDSEGSEETPLRLAPIKSEAFQWAEDIEMNWIKYVSRDDLLHMRDFFKDGMDMEIIEEKIESFPADQEVDGNVSPAPSSTKAKAKAAKGKDDKKGRNSAKSRERSSSRDKSAMKDKSGKDSGKKSVGKQSAKDSGSKDKGKKGKKGEPEIELKHMPPEFTTLATFHIPLQDFLENDFCFENVYVKASCNSGFTTPASEPPGTKKDKKDKDKKKKPDSANKKGAKERGKSPKKKKVPTATLR